jgi:hypothetical protein
MYADGLRSGFSFLQILILNPSTICFNESPLSGQFLMLYEKKKKHTYHTIKVPCFDLLQN